MLQRRHNLLFILVSTGLCLSFMALTLCVLVYMAKDFNGYNLVYSFFGVDASIRRTMEQLPIGTVALWRGLNGSYALFCLFHAFFSMLVSDLLPNAWRRCVTAVMLAVFLLQVTLLDPQVLVSLYMNGTGPFENVRLFRTFYRCLTMFLRVFNSLCILLGCVLTIVSVFLTPPKARTSISLTAALHLGISVLFVYLYGWMPIQPLWMSRVAGYVHFESLPVGKPTALNSLVPTVFAAVMVGFLLCVCVQLYSTSTRRRSISSFRSKVTVSETVTRAFCHYLKNEILSQQAELRLLSMKADDALKPDIAFIMQRNDEINEHLSAVRNTMRQQKITFEPVNLRALVEDTVAAFIARENVPVELRIAHGQAMVMACEDQLRETVSCLLTNALEAQLSSQQPPRLILRMSLAHHYVTVSILNNGPRIPHELLEQIFDPFFTTKKTGQNWGLGLSLCKNVISLFHGRIWVDEEIENGEVLTCFSFMLHLLPEKRSSRS